MTPRIICPGCELKQVPSLQCRRCEARFSYPAAIGRVQALGEKPMPTLAQAERELILAAMARFAGDEVGAAQSIGIGRTTLRTKLRKYGSCTPGQS